MKRLLLILTFLNVSLYPLKAQQTVNAVVQPDCVQNFTFAATGSSPNFSNITGACVNWSMSYASTGFSAISLVVQSAPNVAGVPGSWSTFTAASGSNPNTATTSATSTFIGYFPWMRVTLSSVTGTGKVQGTLYGYKNAAAASSGGGGGGTTITNLATCANGSNTIQRAGITFTAESGTKLIVPASGATSITICGLSMLGDSTTTIKLLYGTGALCGTGTTQITGAGYQTAFGIALDPPIPLPASQGFCVSSSNATTMGGLVLFVQQ